MKPTRIWPILSLLLALLVACDAPPGGEPTAPPTILVPPTGTPILELTATAAATQATQTPIAGTPPAQETPTPTPIAQTPGAATPTPIVGTPGGASPTPFATLAPATSLTYAIGTYFDGARGWVLRGLVPANGGWAAADLPLPAGIQATTIDYDPQSNRGLTWEFTPGVGSGPANLASGPLVAADFTAGTAETLLPEHVVAARWAPGGQGYAYLLATDTTYELHARDAAGNDRLLAADIPREFSFNPAGTAIAFTRESNYNLPSPPGLYVVDLAGGAERQLSDADRMGTGGIGPAWAPIWSPGGESILLRAYADASERLVWAEAGGAWSQTISLSAIDAAAGRALGMDNVCNNQEFLPIAATTLVFGAGPCPEEPLMGALPEATHIVVAELDPATGALTPAGSVPAPTNIFAFLDWDPAARALVVSQPVMPDGTEAFNVTLP
jgi:hypothetical protein